jgi:hypothetical protein
MPNSIFDFSGAWLSVNLKTDTKETCVEKRLDYMLKSMVTILNATSNIREGGLYDDSITQ